MYVCICMYIRMYVNMYCYFQRAAGLGPAQWRPGTLVVRGPGQQGCRERNLFASPGAICMHVPQCMCMHYICMYVCTRLSRADLFANRGAWRRFVSVRVLAARTEASYSTKSMIVCYATYCMLVCIAKYLCIHIYAPLYGRCIPLSEATVLNKHNNKHHNIIHITCNDSNSKLITCNHNNNNNTNNTTTTTSNDNTNNVSFCKHTIRGGIEQAEVTAGA